MMQERSPSLPKLDTETLTSSEDLSVSGKEFTRCNKGICVMYRAEGLYWEKTVPWVLSSYFRLRMMVKENYMVCLKLISLNVFMTRSFNSPRNLILSFLRYLPDSSVLIYFLDTVFRQTEMLKNEITRLKCEKLDLARQNVVSVFFSSRRGQII